MRTYHIHIGGLVQGVGFRPLVCRKALEYGLAGWVCNGSDGLHIRFNALGEVAHAFFRDLTDSPPEHAILSFQQLREIQTESFTGFTIRESLQDGEPDLLLTPDLAICPTCRQELREPGNKRYRYAFTTCLHCGPRYSIIRALPYDREHTTMRDLPLCPDCLREYQDIHDRRHYSQTNSCPTCTIPMHLYEAPDRECPGDPETILRILTGEILGGGIIAVKGTGGYLLIADATNAEAIRELRRRKHRPAKPLALLYRNRTTIEKDACCSDQEYRAMSDPAAPIVLCRLQKAWGSGIQADLIAPGLDKIGIMIPSTPLLQLISDGADRPLVCTSANISGSPIIHRDDQAREELFRFARYLLTYDREIVAPQDDSVVQFTGDGRRIILRRSRGMAPNFHPQGLGASRETLLAMGADMKAAFAIHHRNKVFVSQYLGNQSEFNAQEGYAHTLGHLRSLLRVSPTVILADSHPGYHVTEMGKGLAEGIGATVRTFPHHKAHFAALLAEHRLLHASEPVMGFIWDGTGYGDDGQVWGGETFLFRKGRMERIAHLDYFPQLMGDKMSREPRLSALSLLRAIPCGLARIEKHFSSREWEVYNQPGFCERSELLTSSVGRLLDGISALLTGCAISRYEGEAPMLLEALARSCAWPTAEYYSLPLAGDRMVWQHMMEGILADMDEGEDPAVIAHKVFRSLAHAVGCIAHEHRVDRLAFSGGVFQNALLVELVAEAWKGKKELLFHQQLGPNDENIAFGQLALHHLERSSRNSPMEIPLQLSTIPETINT
jgi:hydrogenase maturation protein HypF